MLIPTCVGSNTVEKLYIMLVPTQTKITFLCQILYRRSTYNIKNKVTEYYIIIYIITNKR